jgi:hypothetical protein
MGKIYAGVNNLSSLVIGPIYPQQNMLINGDFKIDQRGYGEYSTSGYAMDGWVFSFPSSESTAYAVKKPTSVTFQNPNLDTFSMYQLVLIDESYSGKKLCFTYSINGTEYRNIISISSLYPLDPTIFARDHVGSDYGGLTACLRMPVVDGGDHKLICDFVMRPNSGKLTISGVGLYVSDVPVSFVPEDRGLAMLRCLRYLYVFRKHGATNCPSMGQIHHPTHNGSWMWSDTIYFPVPMRTRPSVDPNTLGYSNAVNDSLYPINMIDGVNANNYELRVDQSVQSMVVTVWGEFSEAILSSTFRELGPRGGSTVFSAEL